VVSAALIEVQTGSTSALPNLPLDHLNASITKFPFLFTCVEKYEKNEGIKK
jgi:hypothetical protein